MSSPIFAVQANQISYQIVLPHHEQDYIQGMLAQKGEPYELLMLEAMAGMLQPDDLVLDIGANIGNHTLFLACVAKCKVESFEPNPELCDALAESIKLNELEGRVELHRVGVGARAGKAHFDPEALNPQNIGAQSLSLDADDVNDGFDVITMDSLSFEQSVRMMKIDVEGMELDVLQGAEKLLARDKPTLFVEAQTEDDFEQLNSRLTASGYVYWDTYNATPTHCFIHENDLQDNSYRTHLHELGQKAYQLRYELQKARKQINETGLKYRNALQQIDALKEKLNPTSTSAQSLAKEELPHSNKRISDSTKRFVYNLIKPTDKKVSGDAGLAEELGFIYADEASVKLFDLRQFDADSEDFVDDIKKRLSGLSEKSTFLVLSEKIEDVALVISQLDGYLAAEVVSRKHGAALFRHT